MAVGNLQPWSTLTTAAPPGATNTPAAPAGAGGDKYSMLTGLFSDGNEVVAPAPAPTNPSSAHGVNWNSINWASGGGAGGGVNGAAPPPANGRRLCRCLYC